MSPARLSLLLAMALTAAMPDASHAEEAALRVVLRWRDVPGASAYEVQIAKDRGFSSVVVSERVQVPGYRWSHIPTMRFFWRVRSVDAEGRTGLWTEVKAIEPPLGALRLTSPAEDARFIYDEDGRTLELSAEAPPGVTEYQFQVARTSDFSSLVAEKKSPIASARIAMPFPGTFFWRLKALAMGKEMPPSTPRRFSVTMGPVRLLEPAADRSFALNDELRIDLRWSTLQPAARYQVAVLRNDKPAWQAELRENQARFTPKGSGRYTVSVRPVDAAGQAGPTSEPRSFAVEITPEPLAAVDGQASGGEDPGASAVAQQEQPSLAPPGREGTKLGEDEPGDGASGKAQVGGPEEVDSGANESEGASVRVKRLSVGLLLSWQTSFGVISSPRLDVEGRWRFPWLGGHLLALVRLGYLGAAATIPSSAGLPSPIEATARLIPIELACLYERRMGPTLAYAGAGPMLQIARISLRDEARVSAAPGAVMIAGAAREAGPGQAFLEVGGAIGRVDSPLARSRTGGVILSLGYRMEL
jgi:hypothetical protein